MKYVGAMLVSLVAAGLLSATLLAHQITYKGTVISSEAATLRVNVVDEKTKKVSPMRFILDAETKILRGDNLVTFAAARIERNEKIAVTIDHDLDEELAIVIRLDEKK
jgi:hypothetical protein